MKLGFMVGAGMIAAVANVHAELPSDPPPDKLTFPQVRGAVYDEIRAYQAVGRFVVASDASFFLYEWSRPYAWAPDYKNLAKSTAERKQTFIYKVDASAEPSRYEKPTSQYLFYPAAGATYYMGNLSPDSSMLSFYELNWDSKKIRTGVVLTNDGVSPKITWLNPIPDDSRLNEPSLWISNEELVYPVKTGGTKLIVVNVKSKDAKPCAECDPKMLVNGARTVLQVAHEDVNNGSKRSGDLNEDQAVAEIPSKARLIAWSTNGELEIYSIDTPEVLTLLYKKGTYVNTLFENDRKPKSVRAEPAQGMEK